MSLGKLCNDGFTITLIKTTLQVHKENNLIMTCQHNTKDGLWDIPYNPKFLKKSLHVITQKPSIYQISS